jgi:hypothetical protein
MLDQTRLPEGIFGQDFGFALFRAHSWPRIRPCAAEPYKKAALGAAFSAFWQAAKLPSWLSSALPNVSSSFPIFAAWQQH